MTDTLPNSVLQELAARLEFYRELGIYDFYRRDAGDPATILSAVANKEVEVTPPSTPGTIRFLIRTFANVPRTITS